MVITASSGAYHINKVCEKLANFLKQAGTPGSIRAAYELRHREKKV